MEENNRWLVLSRVRLGKFSRFLMDFMILEGLIDMEFAEKGVTKIWKRRTE